VITDWQKNPLDRASSAALPPSDDSSNERLGHPAVVLDDENAAPPACHAFASPNHCPEAFDPIILPQKLKTQN
jgi:hypothetical protein